jgi:hypothetical protein
MAESESTKIPKAAKASDFAAKAIAGKRALEEKARTDGEKADLAANVYALRCEYTHEHDALYFVDGYKPRSGVPITQDDWYAIYHNAGEPFPELGGAAERPYCQVCATGGRRSPLPLKPVGMGGGKVGFLLTEMGYLLEIERSLMRDRIEAVIGKKEAANG